MSFEIRYTGLSGLLLRLVRLGPGQSIEIVRAQVRVRMGWALVSRFPLAAVREVALDDGRVWEWGVHGWRGRRLVNGSSSGLVRIELEPAQRARALVLPLRLTVLRVSVERPEALVVALRP